MHVVENVGEGLWHVVARFGFFEIPDLREALGHAHGLDKTIDFDQAMFVGTRDLVVSKAEAPALSGWRMALFAFLYRNSVKVVDRFNLAPEHVVEIARQIEIGKFAEADACRTLAFAPAAKNDRVSVLEKGALSSLPIVRGLALPPLLSSTKNRPRTGWAQTVCRCRTDRPRASCSH
jgi:hypothetical protein